jgi:hypothetical protein
VDFLAGAADLLVGGLDFQAGSVDFVVARSCKKVDRFDLSARLSSRASKSCVLLATTSWAGRHGLA